MEMPEKLYYKDENGEFQEITVEMMNEILGIDEDNSLLDIARDLIDEMEENQREFDLNINIDDIIEEINNAYTLETSDVFRAGKTRLELISMSLKNKPKEYCVQVYLQEREEENNGYVTLLVTEDEGLANLQYSLAKAALETGKVRKFKDYFTHEEIELGGLS